MKTEQTKITITPTAATPIIAPNTAKTQGWLNVLKIILPYILTTALFQYIGMLLTGVDIKHISTIQQTSLQLATVYLFSMAGTFMVIWLFMRFIDRMPLVSLGFGSQNILRDVLIGLVTGVVLIVAGFLLLTATGQLHIDSISFNATDFLLNLLLFICVAVTEETFGRGYILGNLMASMNRYVALAVSALLFSLMHLANPHVTFLSMTNIFMAGVLLGLPYIFTRSLWLPIALHLSWNFMQGPVFGYEVSGQKTATVFQTSYHEATIWNGGNFGFEGSLPSLILLIGASVAMYLYYRKVEIRN